MAAAVRSKSIARRLKQRLNDRLDDVPQCCLYDTVRYRRNAQRSTLRASRLRDVGSSHRLGNVRTRAELLRQALQPRVKTDREHFDGDVVDPTAALIGLDSLPCCSEVCTPVYLIDQAVPFPSSYPRFQGFQHALAPHRRFDPRPPVSDLSTTF